MYPRPEAGTSEESHGLPANFKAHSVNSFDIPCAIAVSSAGKRNCLSLRGRSVGGSSGRRGGGGDRT